MKMLTILFLSILLLTFTTKPINGQRITEPQCGENERYTKCESSNCFEKTCADVVAPKAVSKRCRKDCRQGCQCKPGYYRGLDKRCVSEVTCIMCGTNEEWKVGSEETCGVSILKEEANTEKSIVNRSGCYCMKGMKRNNDGFCVSEETCDKCGINEVFETCGSSSCWENTCKDAKDPPKRKRKICTEDCKQGCKCHPGFYRNDSGVCVKLNECDQPQDVPSPTPSSSPSVSVEILSPSFKYIIIFNKGEPVLTKKQFKIIAESYGGKLEYVYHSFYGMLVTMSEANAKRMAEDPRVASVEQDGIVSADQAPSSSPSSVPSLTPSSSPSISVEILSPSFMYIIIFNPETEGEPVLTKEQFKTIAESYGGKLEYVYHSFYGMLVTMSEANAKRMAEDPRVASVEQDGIVSVEQGGFGV